jgi:hypothetical protein
MRRTYRDILTTLQSTYPTITLHFNRQIRYKLIAKVPSYFWINAKQQVLPVYTPINSIKVARGVKSRMHWTKVPPMARRSFVLRAT